MAEDQYKDIYSLQLHECTTVKIKPLKDEYPATWWVTRVPGGWVYQDANPKRTIPCEIFVPYHSEFNY